MGGGRDYYLADFDKFAASNAVSAENELEKSRGKKTTAKLETNKFFSTNKTSKSSSALDKKSFRLGHIFSWEPAL